MTHNHPRPPPDPGLNPTAPPGRRWSALRERGPLAQDGPAAPVPIAEVIQG